MLGFVALFCLVLLLSGFVCFSAVGVSGGAFSYCVFKPTPLYFIELPGYRYDAFFTPEQFYNPAVIISELLIDDCAICGIDSSMSFDGRHSMDLLLQLR